MAMFFRAELDTSLLPARAGTVPCDNHSTYLYCTDTRQAPDKHGEGHAPPQVFISRNDFADRASYSLLSTRAELDGGLCRTPVSKM
ncbi:hypothetical protein BGZ58_004656, partial [Dissophora ornata]